MARKKTIESLIKSPGTIRGVLKRKGIKTLRDPDGTEIPLDYIKDHLLIKDSFTRDIGQLAIEITERMRHFKKLLLEGGPKMYEYLEENDDVRSDSKGGFTEYDFGRNIKVIVSYDLRYDFDDNLMKRAGKHFDAWLKKQGETSVVRAFRKAFQKQDGRYDIKLLNRLNQFEEDDEDFIKAMQLKNEAQTSTPTKLRTQIQVRNQEGEFKSLPLNITDIVKEERSEMSIEYLNQMIDPDPEVAKGAQVTLQD